MVFLGIMGLGHNAQINMLVLDGPLNLTGAGKVNWEKKGGERKAKIFVQTRSNVFVPDRRNAVEMTDEDEED